MIKKTVISDDTTMPVMTDEELNFQMSEKQRIILEKKAASLEKTNQQELWRKLVVKVISWSDGLKSGGIIKKTDKISKEEWKFYSTRCVEIGVNNKSKALQSLEETKKKIESFGGFVD